jgi:hypothetical protein
MADQMKNGLDQYGDHGEQDESLMNVGAMSIPQARANQDAETQEFTEWKQKRCGVEPRRTGSREPSNHIAAEVVAASCKVYEHDRANNDDQQSEHGPNSSQPAMKGCPPCDHENRLREKQH